MGEESKPKAGVILLPGRFSGLVGEDAPLLRMALTIAIVTASIVLALITS